VKKFIYKSNNIENRNVFREMMYSSLNKVIEYNEIIIEPEQKEEVKKVNKVVKKEDNKPIIYIYSTHDTEKYSMPFVSDYSITPDVKLAGYILKDYLNDLKIESKIEKRSMKEYLNKNKLEYKYSYSASRSYAKDELKKNDYKILIDLHRDSTKYKYTLYEKDNKKYARIMFVLGQNYKNYKKNESFMNNLNDRINKKYKGLSRGIYVRKDGRFNQDLSDRAILVELGGVDNTIEEINNTLEVFAKILYEYINEEIYGRK
jgi:stage II sporulation protein P